VCSSLGVIDPSSDRGNICIRRYAVNGMVGNYRDGITGAVGVGGYVCRYDRRGYQDRDI
jgi:hypothetical protein